MGWVFLTTKKSCKSVSQNPGPIYANSVIVSARFGSNIALLNPMKNRKPEIGTSSANDENWRQDHIQADKTLMLKQRINFLSIKLNFDSAFFSCQF